MTSISVFQFNLWTFSIIIMCHYRNGTWPTFRSNHMLCGSKVGWITYKSNLCNTEFVKCIHFFSLSLLKVTEFALYDTWGLKWLWSAVCCNQHRRRCSGGEKKCSIQKVQFVLYCLCVLWLIQQRETCCWSEVSLLVLAGNFKSLRSSEVGFFWNCCESLITYLVHTFLWFMSVYRNNQIKSSCSRRKWSSAFIWMN